jgi:cytochrome c-type biogenesis protein CcmH
MIRVMLLSLLLAGPAFAVEPDEMLADPAQEARARALSKDLRCLVCRNESIDDSHAALARDLRILLRERIAAGDSDAEAVAYIVERYGEYVLLNPTAGGANLLLWLAGPGLLVLGAALAVGYTRRQGRAKDSDSTLTEDEQTRLSRLLNG